MRTVCLGMVLALSACGGKQSPSTTVSSAGAGVPDAHGSGPVSTSELELPHEPVDIDDYAREQADSEVDESTAAAVTDEPAPRDIKMMSYEEAMELPIELGDATSEGGEAQLDADEVASFMDAHLEGMYEECIRRELERGNLLGTVTIDLAVRGTDGMILGATVEPGRRRFKKCLESYLENLRFPTFAAPRMGARYRFHTS